MTQFEAAGGKRFRPLLALLAAQLGDPARPEVVDAAVVVELTHLATLPQGKPERGRRARGVVESAEEEFGPCSVYGECAEVCPAGIPLSAISAVNREAARAAVRRNRDD